MTDETLRSLQRRAALDPTDGPTLEAYDRGLARAERPTMRAGLLSRLAAGLRNARLAKANDLLQAATGVSMSDNFVLPAEAAWETAVIFVNGLGTPLDALPLPFDLDPTDHVWLEFTAGDGYRRVHVAVIQRSPSST